VVVACFPNLYRKNQILYIKFLFRQIDIKYVWRIYILNIARDNIYKV